MEILKICFLLFVLISVVKSSEEPEKSIDEMIRDAAIPADEPNISGRNGDVVVELDMLVSAEDYGNVYGNKPNDIKIDGRKGIRPNYGGSLWPNGIITYEIAPNTFTYQQKLYIESAIAEWQKYTCIQFRQASYYEQRKVVFMNGNGCWSTIGMKGGYQTQYIYLAPNCRYRSIILHEIGHAVGFFHEHTRPDRDDFVSIMQQNVQASQMYNFQKYSWSSINSHGVPYDYTSIMHYSQTAFSSNGGRTIQTYNTNYQNSIGTYKQLSFRDIKTANKMYQCKPNWCQYTDDDCPGEGFIGKDCKCWCVGYPYQLCNYNIQTTRRPTTSRPIYTTPSPPQGSCTDKYTLCNYWARFNRCTNSEFVRVSCKVACKLCNTVNIPPPPVEACEDEVKNCKYWADQGYCTMIKYKWYLVKNCLQSCGVCTYLAHEGKPNCKDTNPQCAKMAADGDCQTNKEIMTKECKASCSLCQ